MARILIIEDDEEMRSLLEDFLKDEGCEADSAPNGSKAFEKLTEDLFDLVITGIRKPGLAGLHILPAITRLQPGASIIFIRGFSREEVRRPLSESRATKNLGEPVYFAQLRKLIREIEEAPSERRIDEDLPQNVPVKHRADLGQEKAEATIKG